MRQLLVQQVAQAAELVGIAQLVGLVIVVIGFRFVVK